MTCADTINLLHGSKGDMKMYTPEKNLLPNAVNCILHKKIKASNYFRRRNTKLIIRVLYKTTSNVL